MANAKEAQARIKINKLLESAGWRFFDEAKGKANVALEPNVKLSQAQINDLGENFEATKNGFVDFLLLHFGDGDNGKCVGPGKIAHHKKGDETNQDDQ